MARRGRARGGSALAGPRWLGAGGPAVARRGRGQEAVEPAGVADVAGAAPAGGDEDASDELDAAAGSELPDVLPVSAPPWDAELAARVDAEPEARLSVL